MKKTKGKNKGAAKKSAKNNGGKTQKPVDLAQVRGDIANLVGDSAADIAIEVIKVAKTGQLAQVKYLGSVTIAEPPPTLKNNPANLFLNIMILCGVLIVFCLVSGLVFGSIRHVWRRSGTASDSDEMISLHLSGRP